MTDLAKLVVRLEAQTAQYMTGLDAANKKLDRFEKQQSKALDSVQRGFRKFSSGIGVAMGAIGIGFSFSKIIQETTQFQNEQAQLEAALRSTGEAAGYNREQLNRMAEDMAKSSTFSAGEINDAQTRLLSYTTIVGETFPAAMQAVIDQSARLGMSMTQSSEIIGRALEKPSRGVTALTRQGFQFSDQQRKLMKQLEETGRTAEAQQIVLDVLAESYGGAAAAARNTLGGALAALRHAFDDLMTGDTGMNGVTESVNGLTDTLNSPAVKEGFAVLITGFMTLISLAAKAAAVIPSVVKQLGEGIAGVISGPIALEYQNLEEIQRKIKGYEQTRDRMMKGQMRRGPNSISNIDTKLAELRQYEAKLLEIQALQDKATEVVATTTGGGAGPIVAELEEIKAAGEKARKDSYAGWLRSLDDSTKTALQKQLDYLDEFEANLAILREEGYINPEEEAERMREALDSVLQEVEPAGEKLGDSLLKQFRKMSVFMEQAFRNTTDIMGNFFEEAMSGKFDNVADDFLKMINSMVAQATAARLGEWLFGKGGEGGGALNSAFSAVGSFFGGSRDSGGRGSRNQAVLIGRGAQPEMFVPDTAGDFYPADMWQGGDGGSSVRLTQNIMVQGRPDQRTPRQLALESARMMRTANARLG